LFGVFYSFADATGAVVVEIKVLHCSDIHLDCSYPDLWGKGNQRRQEQKDIFAHIISLVPAHKIDAVLIAGDLFDLDTLNPATIVYVKDILKTIDPIPVFISPGNKDPFAPESPYACSDWPPNVIIFNTNRFKHEELPDRNVFIYGAANKTSEDTYSALRNLSLKKKEGLHIVLFHGTYLTEKPALKVQCLPFSADDLEKCRAHYLALGHFHEKQCLGSDRSTDRQHYCGAPEFMSFQEHEEKGVIVATISQDKAVTTFLPTWKRRFIREKIDCSPLRDEGQIIDILKRMAEKESYRDAVLHVVLNGSLDFAMNKEGEEIREAVEEHFFSLSLEDETFPSYLLKQLHERKTSMAALASRAQEEFFAAHVDGKEERILIARALKYAFEAFSPDRKDRL
jgi:DNA repair protein SbcD/Mre11